MLWMRALKARWRTDCAEGGVRGRLREIMQIGSTPPNRFAKFRLVAAIRALSGLFERSAPPLPLQPLLPRCRRCLRRTPPLRPAQPTLDPRPQALQRQLAVAHLAARILSHGG